MSKFKVGDLLLAHPDEHLDPEYTFLITAVTENDYHYKVLIVGVYLG